MNLKEIVTRNRTYRRFDESFAINREFLEGLVELARLSPSGGNRQALKFVLINTTAECDRVFPKLSWAAYLPDWAGPDNGERPAAYIIILGDKSVASNFGVDHGIAAQTIMLGAAEAGLGGCIIQSVAKEELIEDLGIPAGFEVLFVLALGKPVENVIIEEASGDEIKYWRDADKNHHVPKRKLNDLILKL